MNHNTSCILFDSLLMRYRNEVMIDDLLGEYDRFSFSIIVKKKRNKLVFKHLSIYLWYRYIERGMCPIRLITLEEFYQWAISRVLRDTVTISIFDSPSCITAPWIVEHCMRSTRRVSTTLCCVKQLASCHWVPWDRVIQLCEFLWICNLSTTNSFNSFVWEAIK